MVEDASTAGSLGRNSPLYEWYTARAAAELAADEDLRAAKAEWLAFFTTSHGDVFGDLDIESPRETLFVDTLYFDFVVDRLIDAVEREVGVRVANPAATHNTDALSVDFRAIHDAVVGGDSNGETNPPVDADTLETYLSDLRSDSAPSESSAGFLRTLYESVISPELRGQLGEYYTPRGVADLAVAELAVDDVAAETFLDPGCGSGVFLAACIDAKRAALDGDPATVVDAITNTVFGIDLNPVAVKGAKLTYLLAVAPLLEAAEIDSVELPVFLTDSLGLTRDDAIRFGGERLDPTVDHLVGNPPWITWGDLAESVRDAWRETYADQLELVPHRGIETRLGHANDDVSIPFVWVCLHRYLARGGDASFVLKRGATKGPAGRLLRTQRVNGRPMRVRHVHDFTTLRPFGDNVDVGSAVYTLRADAEPAFPVDAHSWTRGERKPDFSSGDAIRNTLDREAVGLVPVDDDDPSSSWIRTDAERRALGECDHDVRHGVKDDAAAVFGIDRNQLDRLEGDHVYPYLTSKDVVKYGLFSHGLRLVPMTEANEDNESELRANCPETYAYLESNREALEARSSSWLDGGPFYNVFGLGSYTWSPYKVVWCRLGFKPHFAVVSTVDDEDLGEKPAIPGDHLMFVPTDKKEEAHFLCGLLNSAVYQQSLRGVASEGKASLSKSVVSRLELPEYDDTDAHRRLADLSKRAHEVVPEHTDVSKRAYNRTTIDELAVLQAEIDDLVERLVSGSAVG